MLLNVEVLLHKFTSVTPTGLPCNHVYPPVLSCLHESEVFMFWNTELWNYPGLEIGVNFCDSSSHLQKSRYLLKNKDFTSIRSNLLMDSDTSPQACLNRRRRTLIWEDFVRSMPHGLCLIKKIDESQLPVPKEGDFFYHGRWLNCNCGQGLHCSLVACHLWPKIITVVEY
jgi:hypothetical protein